MPRFVVFDGAPTLDQCISARRAPPASSGRWLTLPLPLPPPLSTSPRQAAAAPPPVVESQYEDADTTIKSDRRSSSASAGGVEPAASQFADADTTGLFSSSKRPRKAALEHAGVEDPSEESSGKRVKRFEESYHEESEEEEQETHRDAASYFLPPPSQPRPRRSFYRQTQQSQSFFHTPTLPSFRLSHADRTELSNAGTTFFDGDSASYDASYAPEGQSVGGPPRFDWKPADLVKLNQLRKSMGRKVHVLAIVIDYTASQEGSRLPSNVTLMDRTGQNATLVLWKDVGRQILGVIRKGDVLYLGNAPVSEYQGKMQLTYNESSSKLGICWRTHLLDEGDDLYQWHEGWRESMKDANEVLEQRDFYQEFLGV